MLSLQHGDYIPQREIAAAPSAISRIPVGNSSDLAVNNVSQSVSQAVASTCDVFISHSHHDKQVADQILTKIERTGLRCWIAPRDVPAGEVWAASIIKAIESCPIMVLVYSSQADRSKQVLREVERAVSKGLVLIPLRTEHFPLSPEMEYLLSATHWLDAADEPMNDVVARLVILVQVLRQSKISPAVANEVVKRRTWLRHLGRSVAMMAAVVALGSVPTWWLMRPTTAMRASKIAEIVRETFPATQSVLSVKSVRVYGDHLQVVANYRTQLQVRVLLHSFDSKAEKEHPAIGWGNHGPNFWKNLRALESSTSVGFVETQLKDALSFLKDQHRINIFLDEIELLKIPVAVDEPINLTISDVPLFSVFYQMLDPLRLDVLLRESDIVITSQFATAESPLSATHDISRLITT